MNIHEYQAKGILRSFGVPVPDGHVCYNGASAREWAKRLGDGPWVVKAQIHAGGRGKGGGVKLARTPRGKQQLQVDRLTKFKKKNAEKAKRALDKLAEVVERGENCFPTLLEAAEVCSLGQITGRLQEVVGRFRPMV